MTRRLESPEDARARLEHETLAESERAQLWQRIATSTTPEAARPLWRERALWITGPAVAAAAVVALFVAQRERPEHARQPKAVAVTDACTLDATARELALPARCAERSVRIADDDWLLAAGAQVARTDGGAHVRAGRVRFTVHKRAAGTQFRVRVSHGEVRVIGTVFVVEQHGGSGSVTVSEGVIEFVWADGQRERVAAGESLHWPRAQRSDAPATKAVAVSDAGTSARASEAGSARATPDLERMLERLLQLQSQKRHGEAVALLRKTLAQPGLAAVQRERISYELGLALEADGNGDGKISCAHWRKHVARFGDQRHTAVLADRIVRCRR